MGTLAGLRRRMTRRRVVAAAAFLAVLIGVVLAPAAAQRRGRFWDPLAEQPAPAKTDFVFARVYFNSGYRGFGFGGGGWAHDYPTAEHHILDLTGRLTRIHVEQESYVIVRLDSEEIFDYPFLYFSEVGEMNLTPEEIENFRAYLDRGGIAMIDDFDSAESLEWFASQMRLVYPGRGFSELPIEHSLFHTGYDIDNLDMMGPGAGGQRPAFYGYFDDKGRLLMIVNHNNDIGDLWEWYDQPMYPLESTIKGVRLGINYLLYSLTH